MRWLRAVHTPNWCVAESGSSLLDTAVALSIISVVAVTFLSGITISSRAAVITNTEGIGESLAQSQLEYAKRLAYVYEATEYSPAALPDGPAYTDYSVEILAEPLNTPDDGIQKITVIVQHHDTEVHRLVGYKVDR